MYAFLYKEASEAAEKEHHKRKQKQEKEKQRKQKEKKRVQSTLNLFNISVLHPLYFNL